MTVRSSNFWHFWHFPSSVGHVSVQVKSRTLRQPGASSIAFWSWENLALMSSDLCFWNRDEKGNQQSPHWRKKETIKESRFFISICWLKKVADFSTWFLHLLPFSKKKESYWALLFLFTASWCCYNKNRVKIKPSKELTDLWQQQQEKIRIKKIDKCHGRGQMFFFRNFLG